MITILLVEDQVAVRTFTRRLLQRNGYEVIEAESAEAALRLWPDCGERIHLVLTDLSMPGGVNGDTLARQLKAQRPRLPVVFTSGYGAGCVALEPRLIEGENFIPKPAATELILRTIGFSLASMGGSEDPPLRTVVAAGR
jgi:two-component system, cell cycle sensor histidine kinase and response regulator CckA